MRGFHGVSQRASTTVKGEVPPGFPCVRTRPHVNGALPVERKETIGAASLQCKVHKFNVMISTFTFNVMRFTMRIKDVIFLFKSGNMIPHFNQVNFCTKKRKRIRNSRTIRRVLTPLFIRTSRSFSKFFQLTIRRNVILVSIMHFPMILTNRRVDMYKEVGQIFVFQGKFIRNAQVQRNHVAHTKIKAKHPPRRRRKRNNRGGRELRG